MIENRKADHIRICLTENVQAKQVTTGFEDVHLIHRALPEIACSDVDLRASFLNHKLKAPILIEAMTGGTQQAAEVNGTLAEAAEHFGLAMGVGSQRAALESPELAYTFRIARERGPDIFLLANLGLAQILEDGWKERVERAIEMIEADALVIHLNPLQEAVQREGSTDFRGALSRLRKVVSHVSVPVMVKETGAGIAMEDARALEGVKISGIDVGGAGGTSWAAVESFREQSEELNQGSLGRTFWDWGIPTAVSIVEVTKSTSLTTVASGGIRTGVDAAKAIALGASICGLALPLLRPAVEGWLETVLSKFLCELKTSMFLAGTGTVEDLKLKPLVFIGKTAEWLRSRGFRPEEYSVRV